MLKAQLFIAILTGLFLGLTTAMAAEAPSTQPAWQQPYSGQDATGPNVIALWHFDADAPTKDASGHGHDLKLQPTGSKFSSSGKFGGSLQITLADKVVDKPHGVQVADSDSLTPKGAFSIEMWIRPDARLTSLKTAYLLDKKGYPYKSDRPHANDDYLLQLVQAPGNQFYLEAQLGYGTDSDILRSRPVTLDANKWHHIGYSYDGKGGSRFSVDAEDAGFVQHEGRGAISNGIYPLAIGDRTMSIHGPFSGKIDEVRLSNGVVRFAVGKVRIDTDLSRTAFYRLEKDATLHLRVTNNRDQALDGASVKISADGMDGKPFKLPDLKPNESAIVDAPVDTRLHIGQYATQVIALDNSGKPLGDAAKINLTLVARPIPNTMPVMMWGTPDAGTFQQLKDIGFTDCLLWVPQQSADKELWSGAKAADQRAAPAWQNVRKQLDELMNLGLGGAPELTPGYYASSTHKQYDRVDRDGKPYKESNIDGLFPQVQDYCYKVGAMTAKTLGDLPSFKASLIHTEVRDATRLSFHEIDKAAYKKFSGQNIPVTVSSIRGTLYHALSDFPANRIVPDNYPILEYLRWFWKVGDGWNELNTLVSKGVHSTGRSDIWTWFDPAIRVPSVWGSGGKVDVISQWTYSYPNPLDIGLACDDLMAMAQGQPGQKVMNMIQIIWYRSQTAPILKKGEKAPPNQAAWEKELPDAPFISIAPDHLSEGMWLELAHPIKGIMNHGWGSLGDKLGYKQGSYFTTNVDTRTRLTEMLHKVVQPLGPTLMQVPDRKADVAYLQSFASQMLAGRGTYGWGGGWGADAYMLLRYAAIQPQIVYDETIEKEGLDQYKVLVLVDCDVLTKSVADAIEKFQSRGGIVIGDEHLAPGIQPDILLQSYARTATPDKDKAVLLERAAKLRKDLGAYYTRAADSSNPQVIVRLRQYDDSDYLFAVNDHRTYGDYVGQHRKVMEKGLPSQATLSLNRPDGIIYDLCESRQVKDVQKADGRLSFKSDFGPGQGRLFLVTTRPIAAVHVKAPDQASAGDSITCDISVTDDAGKAIDAVIPLQVKITDANGNPAEFSGYYGAKDGKVEINLDVPTNAAAGQWKIQATELASGLNGEAGLQVRQ
jgi:hypothetical protein